MILRLELNETDLKQLVLDHCRSVTGNDNLQLSDVKIETKSKQNYRSEWETASWRASLEHGV
jgi:hypothetical protein